SPPPVIPRPSDSFRAGFPIQTPVAYRGVYPINQTSVWLLTVPVLPASGCPAALALPAVPPPEVTPRIISTIVRATYSLVTFELEPSHSSSRVPSRLYTLRIRCGCIRTPLFGNAPY